MSHPDPLFDPENAYEDDDMMIEDENYDDYNDFHEGEDEEYSDDYDDSMDGDMESGLASAGYGMDEDYGYYGDDNYCGEDY
mgnify:CR=1 FL=1